jgi:O-antigen/teichoic acid export membrane protein
MASSSDAKTRGKSRLLRVSLTGGATLLSKGITFIAGLIAIPLVAQYLGAERFGMWLTLSSFLAWVGLADVGLATSLTNILAIDKTREDRQEAQSAVSNVFWLLVLLSLVASIILGLAYRFISWEHVANVISSEAKADLSIAVITTMVLLVLRLLLSLPRQIYSAYQEGYLYQIWSTLGSVLAIIGLWTAVYLKGNTAILLAAFFGLPLLSDLGAIIHLFGFQRPWLMPALDRFSWAKSKRLLTTGSQIWVSQISGIIIFQTEILIINQHFGAVTVGAYGTLLKLLSIVSLAQISFAAPLWPAYCEAISSGDIQWVKKTFIKSSFISFVWATVVGGVITIAAPHILNLWLGHSIKFESLVYISLFLRTVLLSIDQCLGMLCNGLGLFKIESVMTPFFACVYLILALGMTNAWGVQGCAWAMSICIIIFSVFIFGFYSLKEIKRLENLSLS